MNEEEMAIEAMLDLVQPDYPNLTRDELRDIFHATYDRCVAEFSKNEEQNERDDR